MNKKPKLWWHIAFRQQMVFLGMLVTFCGPMMGVVTYGIGQSEARFAEEGVTVDGTVTAKSQVTKVGKSGGTSPDTYLSSNPKGFEDAIAKPVGT